MLIEEKATQNVSMQLVNPYARRTMRLGGNLKFERLDVPNKADLDFVTDEVLLREQQANQNVVLGLFVTPRHFQDTGAPAPSLQVLSAYSHASFIHAFNMLSNEEKANSRILRPYWLGNSSDLPLLRESSDVEKLVSEKLVSSLAEKVRLYKANVPIGRLLKYKPQVPEELYSNGLEYQEWFKAWKEHSKYEFTIVTALANGKKGEAIKDFAFGTEADVITKDEIEQVIAAVKAKPEPTLPYRPAKDNLAENLANALKQTLVTTEIK